MRIILTNGRNQLKRHDRPRPWPLSVCGGKVIVLERRLPGMISAVMLKETYGYG
jgi:hypothetical protein